MAMKYSNMSAKLAGWVPPILLNSLVKKNTHNLAGDRDVEWPWIAAQIPDGPRGAIDIGTGGSFLGLIAARRQFKVTAVDLQPVRWHYIHPELQFMQGDILKLSLPVKYFNPVITCSTIQY